MKTLIIYDSAYGNTEQIAQAIGCAIGSDAKVIRAGDAKPDDIKTIEFLIVGSPTQGGRPTHPVRDFLNNIPDASLKGIKVAAFDTRISTKLVGVFGYAAGRIEVDLKAKGGIVAVPPEGFFVTGNKVPTIKEGELERAVVWAKTIVKGVSEGRYS